MDAETVITLGQKALEMTFLMAFPILMATFVVGLVVSIFQAATQIQEMTLSYIPKIIAAYVTVFLLGGWMLSKMVDYTKELIINIPAYLR